MTDWLALAGYTFVMSITPGPNNVMLLASGANHGFRRTLPHLAGVCIGFTAQTLVVCAGLGAFLREVPQLATWLGWVGVAYLCVLAARLLGLGPVGAVRAARPLSVRDAMAFQLVNPKAWAMAFTTATVFAPKAGEIAPALALMGVLLALVNLPCISVWAACGEALRRWLDDPRWRRAFNLAMALLLLLSAVSMLHP